MFKRHQHRALCTTHVCVSRSSDNSPQEGTLTQSLSPAPPRGPGKARRDLPLSGTYACLESKHGKLLKPQNVTLRETQDQLYNIMGIFQTSGKLRRNYNFPAFLFLKLYSQSCHLWAPARSSHPSGQYSLLAPNSATTSIYFQPCQPFALVLFITLGGNPISPVLQLLPLKTQRT